MTLGASVTNGDDPNVFPACFADPAGQVRLRGHVDVAPVSATGGLLIAAFPYDANGDCSCTPEANELIATTSAIVFPRNPPLNPSVPDICVVRLSIDRVLPPDVNQDGYINQDDVTAIQTDPNWSSQLAPAPCGAACGPADVNRDGLVNYQDEVSVTQSAFLGQHVPCGGVYATQFACGSSQQWPIIPSYRLSLDSILYLNDDGISIMGAPFMHQTRDAEVQSLRRLVEEQGSQIQELKDLVNRELLRRR